MYYIKTIIEAIWVGMPEQRVRAINIVLCFLDIGRSGKHNFVLRRIQYLPPTEEGAVEGGCVLRYWNSVRNLMLINFQTNIFMTRRKIK